MISVDEYVSGIWMGIWISLSELFDSNRIREKVNDSVHHVIASETDEEHAIVAHVFPSSIGNQIYQG